MGDDGNAPALAGGTSSAGPDLCSAQQKAVLSHREVCLELKAGRAEGLCLPGPGEMLGVPMFTRAAVPWRMFQHWWVLQGVSTVPLPAARNAPCREAQRDVFLRCGFADL